MARRSTHQGDHAAAATIHYSSLALLQERFNQLQKTREMRQEKELMRFISHAAANTNTNTSTSTAMHCHHQPVTVPAPASCYYYDSDELMMFHQLQKQPSSQMGFSFIPLPPPQLIIKKEASHEETQTKSLLLFGSENLLGLHNHNSGTSTSSPLLFDLNSCTTPPDVDTSLHL